MNDKETLIHALKIDPEKKLGPQLQKTRRLRGWVAAGIACVLLGASVAAYLWRRTPKVEVVRAEAVQEGLPEVILTAGGYVVADSTILVSSQINGKVKRILVDEGQLVARGQLLAEIEDDDYQAKYRMAKAEYELAALTLKRKTRLREQEVISQAEYDETAKLFAVKKAAFESARYFLENTQIRAPIDGTILKKEKEAGEFLLPGITSEGVPGSAVMKIADLRVMNVEAEILESDLPKTKLQQPCAVFPDALPSRSYRAKLFYIAPQADRQKSVVKLKLRIEQPDDVLKPEMSVRVYFLAQEATGAIARRVVVPQSSVFFQNRDPYVFLVKKDELLAQKIEIASQKDGKVSINSGLTGDESVVLTPHPRFKSGMKVEVKNGTN